MNAPQLLDRVVSLLFPPRCIFCQELVTYDQLYCGKCSFDTNTDYVFAKVAASGAADAVAVMAYKGVVTQALVSYKIYGDKRATNFFSGEIHRVILNKWKDVGFDIVTFVPMNKKRRKKRGFNQAQLMASGIAELIEAPVRGDMLVRLDSSLAQHELGRNERSENAANSYISGNMAGVEGKNVLLVDDIITTGATASACVRLLRKAGSANVFVAVVASSE